MHVWWWAAFIGLIVVLLVIDLGIFHRRAHEVSSREAAIWSVVWISLALGFNVFVYYEMGMEKATEFFTGYLIEKSLSVDNLFVFVLIFSYFNVPARYQHRILFWGIIGALIMRASLIFLGIFLIERFSWIIYVFGAFLVYTGVRMAIEEETTVEIEANPVIGILRRWFPVSDRYHDQHFFVREGGRTIVTPMLVVLLLIESTDLVFALDSIPAIFAVTKDPFIVYTSNIFAILGLRALYFLLANVINRFYLLKYGLAVVLAFIGAKMIVEHWYEIDTLVSLAVVATILTLSVAGSLIWPQKEDAKEDG